MAPQQNIFTALRANSANATPVDDRVASWLYGNYFYEHHVETTAHHEAVLSRAEFNNMYLEPEAAPEFGSESASTPSTPTTSLSSESGGVQLLSKLAAELDAKARASRRYMRSVWDSVFQRRTTSDSSGTTDTSTTHHSLYSWGVRSLRQPRSLPEVVSALPKEAGEGYEADVSASSGSDETSSTTWTGSTSTTLYTPSEESSDLDSEGQDIASRVDEITRDHHERMNDIQQRQGRSGSVSSSTTLVATPEHEHLLAELAALSAAEGLRQLDHDHVRALEELRSRPGSAYSRGEYLAELAEVERAYRVAREAVERSADDHLSHGRQ